MGAHGGPNMVEDGMVFGYDTGNSKSYAGEPTTNLHPNPEDVSSWTGDLFGNWTRSTVTSNVSIAPDGTLTADRIGDGYGRFNSSITAIPGQTYVYTVYLKNVSLTNNFGIAVAWGLNGSLVSYNGSATTVQISQISNTEWTRVTATEVAPSSGINQVQFGPCPFTGYGNPSGQTIDVWGGMIEQKSHATPYTTGTRSATEGLIDFKDSTTLDLSNVSFDSDAQMTFDGTDDYFALPSNIRSLFSSGPVAVEIVLKKLSADQSNMVAFDVDVTRWNLNYNEYVSGQWSFDFYDGTERVIPAGNYDNEYVHFVLQQLADNTLEIYANGELKGSEAAGPLAPNGNTVRIGSRSNGDSRYFKGELPLVRIYDIALTAEEVQNNFNGIRNRFGI